MSDKPQVLAQEFEIVMRQFKNKEGELFFSFCSKVSVALIIVVLTLFCKNIYYYRGGHRRQQDQPKVKQGKGKGMDSGSSHQILMPNDECMGAKEGANYKK